jgi:hypothetical protein
VNFNSLAIDSKEVFYTDSNGLKMVKRKLHTRPSFPMRTKYKIQSNIFPVSSAIAIIDPET